MEELFANEFVLALYGFLIYTLLLFVITKDGYDKQNKKFDYKAYLKKNYDNFLLSILMVPVITFYAVDIFHSVVNDYFEKDWHFLKVYYLFLGAVVELLYLGIAKIRPKKEK